MWRRGTFVCLMAHSPLRLHGKGTTSNVNARRMGGITNTASSTSGGKVVDERTTQSTAASAASPQSAPSPTTATNAAPSLASLVSAVEQLREGARRTQHTLRSQEEATQLLQQKFALMERQMGQLESSAESLRGKLTEVHRVVGEMVMRQRNTDLLIQQMERRQGQLQEAPASSSPPTPPPAAQSGRNMEDAPSGAAAAEKACATDTAVSVSPVPPANSLADKVAQLEARVQQLTMDIFGADRLTAAAAAAKDAMPATAGDLAAVLASTDAAAKRVALVRELQRRHAVSLFTDAAGVTRVASQCVRLHNIPLNLGATAVREVCVRQVCGGDSSGLVSCMVRRGPGGGFGSGPLPAAQSPPSERAPVYSSQQQTQAMARDAAAGALPRGDAVAPVQPNTKSFDVVFATAALAVRALTVLNGLQLRPSMHGDPLPLAVEPLVSAEVVTAMQELEISPRDVGEKS